MRDQLGRGYVTLARAIGRAQRISREIAAVTAAEFDLFPSELNVLLALAEAGEMRMGDVAKRLSISPSNATRLVKRLEGNALLRRARSMASNREVMVALTARGQSINRACGPKLEAAFRAHIDAALSEPDQHSLLDRFNGAGGNDVLR